MSRLVTCCRSLPPRAGQAGRLAVIATGLAALALPSVALAAPPPAPPVSDGSSGSFYTQITNDPYLVWFNTDNGQVYASASGGYIANTVPSKPVKYNGQKLNAYNFTDITVLPGQTLTIYGSKPALLLASGPVNIAGTLVIQANAGAAGAPAPDSGSLNGNEGGNPGGGGGGAGGGGETQGAFCTEGFTAGGGGGGGNFAAGLPGLQGYYPTDAADPRIAAPGPGGHAESPNKLQGGGGGGSGGGSNSFGNFWAETSANGGGAVAISTTGSFTIASTGTISVSGLTPNPFNAGTSGHSGAGAGGDAWLFATGGFVNDGTLSAHGGTGTTTVNGADCAGNATLPGPNGGNGAGGVIKIDAATVQNNGLIDVSTGGGGTANGGYVGLIGKVLKGKGTIIGRKGHAT